MAEWDYIRTAFIRLMGALPLTLEIWALSMLLGGIVAAALVAMRESRFKSLQWIARAYVFVFRGTPLLIQLFIIYYGLPTIPFIRHSFLWPVLKSAFSCAVISLALCTAAYESEIFRGALKAIPHGQLEAGRACGMSNFILFRRIIWPNFVRLALPAYTTEMISMVKSTALVSLITLWDVMSTALKIRNDTLVTYTPLMIAGAIYFTVSSFISVVMHWIEQRLSGHLASQSSSHAH